MSVKPIDPLSRELEAYLEKKLAQVRAGEIIGVGALWVHEKRAALDVETSGSFREGREAMGAAMELLFDCYIIEKGLLTVALESPDEPA